jgi:hypothetical protein
MSDPGIPRGTRLARIAETSPEAAFLSLAIVFMEAR